jgi:sugar phosphate permease
MSNLDSQSVKGSLINIKSNKVLPFLYKSWLIWGCAALFYCYQFMLRVSPGVMAKDLMASFNVDACALGTIVGFYYYTYAALQIPVGTLMDRFKPRRMLTFAAILCSFGTLIFSYADSLYIAAFGRALIGAGSAFAFLSCLKLGTLWFPSQKLPFVVGMTLLLGTLGGAAGYPIGWLVQVSGWRHALWLIAFAGFVLALLGWSVIRDKAPKSLEEAILKSHGDENDHAFEGGIFKNIREVIVKPQSWFIAFYGFLMFIPLSGFADLWGPPFLMSAYQLDEANAGAVISAMYIGIGLGAPLFPFLCEQMKAYKPPVFISALGAFVFLSAAFYIPHLPFWALVSFLFLAGFFLGGQFLGFSMTCSLNPLSASATAGGFHNMLCMLSGVVFQPFIGWLLDYSWKEGYINGIRNYTASDYKFALSSISLSLIFACVIVLFIEEKYIK